MAKVIFKLDKQKDINNWHKACNSTFMGVDWKLKIEPLVRKSIVGVNKKQATHFLEKYLTVKYKKDKNFIKLLTLASYLIKNKYKNLK